VCRRVLRVPRDLRLVDRSVIDDSAPKVAEDKATSTTTTESGEIRDIYGSKIDALIKLINRILVRRDCKKIVLFAQFQHLLTLIADVLKANGINFVIARGSIRSTERAFRAFHNDNSVRMILLSS